MPGEPRVDTPEPATAGQGEAYDESIIKKLCRFTSCSVLYGRGKSAWKHTCRADFVSVGARPISFVMTYLRK